MAKKSNRKKIERVAQTSADLTQETLSALKDLLPQAFTEGKIDFAKLRSALGDEVDDNPERYSFTWAGKRDAIRLLQTPSRATLVPVPEESVNFDTTKNVFIEGENLEVLKLLYKSYAGRVKMIYIDPPYNTGNDFIYPDNFADPLDTYLKLTGQKDSEGNLLTSNPETSGRFHSAWLTMMYPRLFVARQLLREDGAIFISIDDHEVANLRWVMNEVFGEENFAGMGIWQRKYSPQNDDKGISALHEYVCVYAKSKKVWEPTLLPRTKEGLARYKNPDKDPRGPWKTGDFTSKTKADGHSYPITAPGGKVYRPVRGRQWGPSLATFERLLADNRIWFGPDGQSGPSLKQFLSEVQQGTVPTTLWLRDLVGDNQEAIREVRDLGVEFDSPKPVRLVSHMLKIASMPKEEDIILDFFTGSGTTGHSVLQQNREDGGNRHFIAVQIPEPVMDKPGLTIAEIAKQRIRCISKKLEDESKGKLDLKDRGVRQDLGFKVFKLAESNYQRWRGADAKTGEALLAEMEKHVDPLLPGWKPMNVICEVALKEGYSLTSGVEEVKGVSGNMVYRVTDADKGQSFLICLDGKLKAVAIKSLGLKKDDLFICRDVAMTDEQAANLALQCKVKTI
ncbi:MAG: site-specific DNA-methyltransferase [Planctomycetaceae bacterium]|nr:site-specific DNA-methyltransferase [Planctomycetaceae bacterium]